MIQLLGRFVLGVVVGLPVVASTGVAQERPTERPAAAPGSEAVEPTARDDGPELALRGYCPVSYHTDGKAVMGDAKFSVEHRGFIYHLADAEKKKTFEAEPEKYVPAIGGLCTVALGGPYGNRFCGDPRVFAILNGKLYLCSSERAKRSFDQKPESYVAKAEELYKKPELRGMCPVSIFNGPPAAGSAAFAYTHRGFVYHFQNAQALEEFKKQPDRYVPRYEGYCASGVAQGKLWPGDPALAEKISDRVYLFLNTEEKSRCLSGKKPCTSEADARWPELKKDLRKAPGGT